MYSTDNGPHMNTWPDGAMTPFRSEKNSNWEGRPRAGMMRWPAKSSGVVSNEIISHTDWLPTLLAVNRHRREINEKLDTGPAPTVANRSSGVHRRLQLPAVPDRQIG